MDEHCVFTTEEDQVMSKAQFLKELSPLPPGLAGDSAVGDLQVPQYPTFAIVRFLADEWETVFGRRVTTQYRVTDTFVRAGNSWKMVGSHASVV